MITGKTFFKIAKNAKKGSNGTILVIGGSDMYTGAPIFSAKAALRSGSDLAIIMCPESASISIKSLHEASVVPIAYNEYLLSKITACVIGPGLGRIKTDILDVIILILEFLNKSDVPCIIDADAIHYYKQGHFNFIKNAIITPNYKEMINLNVQSNHIYIYKGAIDCIVHGDAQYLVFNKGSDKRAGGQGDILTGVLATALSIDKDNLIEACISSCELVRLAANIGFLDKGFGLIASDVIEKIPDALRRLKNA